MEPLNILPQEDILHLTSLKEVFAGFAHEIAQPLNTIMIASQVIQLKLDKTFLPEEDKGFLKQRLDLIASQVQRATEIIENLRLFTRCNKQKIGPVGIKNLFEKVYGLMGQQFVNRGIEIQWEGNCNVPCEIEKFHFLEGVLVQGLAFARDYVLALSNWYDTQAKPYEKKIKIRAEESDCCHRILINWNTGNLSPNVSLIDVQNHAGLLCAGYIVGSMGGKFESSPSGLTIALP